MFTLLDLPRDIYTVLSWFLIKPDILNLRLVCSDINYNLNTDLLIIMLD